MTTPPQTTTRTSATAVTTLAPVRMAAAVADGAVVVDIRSTAQRERQGVLVGALAVDARSAGEYVDPASPTVLAAVARGGEVLLVSDDGIDAELFTWELHHRGVTSVRAVTGGFEALAAAGGLRLLAAAAHVARESAAIAAH